MGREEEESDWFSLAGQERYVINHGHGTKRPERHLTSAIGVEEKKWSEMVRKDGREGQG